MEHSRLPFAMAVDFIKSIRKGQRIATILKAMTGMAAAGNLAAFAKVYREWAVPLDRGIRGEIHMGIEEDARIPLDFWQHDTAAALARDNLYLHGVAAIERQSRFSNLPYRMRGPLMSGQNMLLSQVAEGIEFDFEDLWNLTHENDWRPWLEHFYRAARPGPEPTWKRLEAMAAFAVRASNNPEIIRLGRASITNELRDIFVALQDDYPSKLDDLVDAILAHAEAPEDGSPPN